MAAKVHPVANSGKRATGIIPPLLIPSNQSTLEKHLLVTIFLLLGIYSSLFLSFQTSNGLARLVRVRAF